MLYYAANHLKSDGAIMVTGSHNPSNHNGFKIMKGTVPFFGDDISDIGVRGLNGDWSYSSGSSKDYYIEDEYIKTLLKSTKINNFKNNIKVVWDPGNGAAGDIIKKLVGHLPGEHILINETIDGSFPAHHPDPTDPKNLEEMISVVKDNKFDVGVAFDGDGDRLGLVSGNGNIIWGDQIVALLSQEVLKDNPNSPIIADVKASQTLFNEIKRLGGVPIMWKTGHSFIKSKMKEISSPLAGEMSGHFFLNDRWPGFDDSLYNTARLLEIIAREPSPESGGPVFSDWFTDLPNYASTGEAKVPLDRDREETMDFVTNAFTDMKKSTVDGVRVRYPDGWYLCRPSNTEPILVMRAEASSEENLKKIKEDVEYRLGAKINLKKFHES